MVSLLNQSDLQHCPGAEHGKHIWVACKQDEEHKRKGVLAVAVLILNT